VFNNLHQLKSLSLTDNVISSIEPRVFDESANLSSLSRIDLSRNVLTELEPWPLIRAQHRSMSIALQHNFISNFTNALHWRYDCHSTRVFETFLDVHDNDIKHITDAINSWNIEGRLPALIIRPPER